MAKTRHRWLTLTLDWHEIAIDDLATNDRGLEVPQFVLEHTVLIFATKKVNTIMHQVTLFRNKIIWVNLIQSNYSSQKHSGILLLSQNNILFL